MKKYIAITLLLTAALTLSACKAEDNIQVENGGGTPSQTTTQNTPNGNGGENTGESNGESTGESSEESTGDNSGEQPSGNTPSEDVLALIGQFDVDSFTAPDGTEVMLTEAVSQINDFALYFDFAYIRYAFPIYSDTAANPEIYDFEEFEFTVDNYTKEVPEYFKAAKGDVLDNGMTVAEAKYALTPYDVKHPFENYVELEGECTLEGILYRCPEDDYMIAKDDVYFYPNPASGTVPDPYDPYAADMGEIALISAVYLYSEFAFMSDGGAFDLGNVNELSVDVADWFGDSPYVKVRVTLDGMKIRYSENFGSQCWSTLKSAERMDG